MDYNSIATILSLPIAFALFLVINNALSRKLRNLPPGPFPIPIVGNLFHLFGDLTHRSLAKISDKYGPIISLKLGQVTTIVVSSPSLAKEVLQTQDLAFSSRYIPEVELALNHANYSVIFLPVESKWRSLRKVLNTSLFTRNRLNAKQSLRFRKVQELVAYCNKFSQSGKAMDMSHALHFSSLNLVYNTMFSKDVVDLNSDSDNEFTKVEEEMMHELSKLNLANFFPFLARFDPQGRKRNMGVYFLKLIEHFRGIVKDRMEKIKGPKSNDEYDDLLRALLAANHDGEIDMTHIEHICLDIGSAGATTSSTIEWAMTELLRRPSTMKKLQEELDQVIGKGKQLEESDIARLPYLNCVLKETMRLHPVNPLLFPRKNVQQQKLGGYTIPKNSQILVNVWKIGRDPTVWEDPLTFKPERFWESDIDIRGCDFELLPFGAGRRICPGMTLGWTMVQYIVGTLVNLFEWKLEDGVVPEELDMDEAIRLTIHKKIPLRVVPISVK